MKESKKWLKPVLFTAGGAISGLAYYYFVGCVFLLLFLDCCWISVSAFLH